MTPETYESIFALVAYFGILCGVLVVGALLASFWED